MVAEVYPIVLWCRSTPVCSSRQTKLQNKIDQNRLAPHDTLFKVKKTSARLHKSAIP
jgi:hypothetical protein